MKEYWERDFYQIEMEDNEKYIHIMGYFYDEGQDYGNGTSRCVEFTWCKCPLATYLEMNQEERDEMESICNTYSTDMTPDEAIKSMNTYYMGELPTEMSLDEINMDTPCGCYVDWKGEE